MTTPYSPAVGSIAWKVCQFLADNPDEELARSDIALKFGTTAAGVDALLAKAVMYGALRKTRNREEDVVWIRGANPARIEPAGTKAKPQAEEADPAPFLVPTRLEDGLPVIRPHPIMTPEEQRALAWQAWLGEFKPGHSAEFAESLLAEIRAAVKRYAKATGCKFRLVDLGQRRWGIEQRK